MFYIICYPMEDDAATGSLVTRLCIISWIILITELLCVFQLFYLYMHNDQFYT